MVGSLISLALLAYVNGRRIYWDPKFAVKDPSDPWSSRTDASQQPGNFVADWDAHWNPLNQADPLSPVRTYDFTADIAAISESAPGDSTPLEAEHTPALPTVESEPTVPTSSPLAPRGSERTQGSGSAPAAAPVAPAGVPATGNQPAVPASGLEHAPMPSVAPPTLVGLPAAGNQPEVPGSNPLGPQGAPPALSEQEAPATPLVRGASVLTPAATSAALADLPATALHSLDLGHVIPVSPHLEPENTPAIHLEDVAGLPAAGNQPVNSQGVLPDVKDTEEENTTATFTGDAFVLAPNATPATPTDLPASVAQSAAVLDLQGPPTNSFASIAPVGQNVPDVRDTEHGNTTATLMGDAFVLAPHAKPTTPTDLPASVAQSAAVLDPQGPPTNSFASSAPVGQNMSASSLPTWEAVKSPSEVQSKKGPADLDLIVQFFYDKTHSHMWTLACYVPGNRPDEQQKEDKFTIRSKHGGQARVRMPLPADGKWTCEIRADTELPETASIQGIVLQADETHPQTQVVGDDYAVIMKDLGTPYGQEKPIYEKWYRTADTAWWQATEKKFDPTSPAFWSY